MIQLVIVQLRRLMVHWVNVISNIFLGDDYVGIMFRQILLKLLGNQFGPGTKIRGGSYIGWGKLSTGSNCFLNRNLYIDTTGKILLGDNVTVGHGVTIITAHHEIGGPECRSGSVSSRPVSIHDGAWIGANATLLPGITIGQGAVVAAGAVVTGDVVKHSLVAGIPAKSVRQLDGDVAISEAAHSVAIGPS